MQNTKKTPTTKNFTITLSKEIGNIWIIEDITPFHKKFKQFFDKELGHDIGKLMTCGCPNYVLDILAGDVKRMDIDLRLAEERLDLPDFVEFELVEPCSLSAKYLVNNCPGRPQLIAWANGSTKEIFNEYPAFAYIKKK